MAQNRLAYLLVIYFNMPYIQLYQKRHFITIQITYGNIYLLKVDIYLEFAQIIIYFTLLCHLLLILFFVKIW